MRVHPFELRQLRYFCVIAQVGTLTGAAEKLHIAQPALSQHLKKLEEALGCALLYRMPRGVRLTSQGEHFLEQARAILALADQLTESFVGKDVSGEFILGLPMTVSPLITQALVKKVRDDYPDVSLRIREGLSPLLSEWLVEGRLDAAILFENQTDPRLLMSPLCTEELYVVGPAQRFGVGAEIPVKSLGDFPLIAPGPSNALFRLCRAAAQAQGIQLRHALEIDVVSEIIHFIERGDGYAVLAPIAFHEALAAGRVSVARVTAPVLQRTLTWAVTREQAGTRLATAMKPFVTEILQDYTARSGRHLDHYLVDPG